MTARADQDSDVLLNVEDLHVHFQAPQRSGIRLKKNVVKAVDGVSFAVRRGETVGIVGESGCGKSTLGNTIVRLEKPTSGSVIYAGTDLSELSDPQMKAHRQDIQIIQQDPYSSLNPRIPVGKSIEEPLWIFRRGNRATRRDRVNELLESVGLDARAAQRLPHEFSGGQRQRIGIARALALDPKLVVCDEPVSALDVSIQAQIVTLLEDLQQQRELTYLFIAHDLSVVRHIADRVMVMYLGKVVEIGTCDEVFNSPRHPYTQALLSAVPIPDPVLEAQREQIVLRGDVPTPLDIPSGCRFRTRCGYATSLCEAQVPVLEPVSATHATGCLRWKEITTSPSS